MATQVDHGLWSSRFAFILAATGAAVGLGNIWKFPYIMGDNGGGAFVIVYLLCILTLGLPVMMAEVLIGRRGRQSPGYSVRNLAIEAGASVNWSFVGWMGLLSGFLILCFYAVIAGWSVSYIFKTASGSFTNASPDQVANIFNSFLQSPKQLIAWTTLIIVITGGIIGKGLNNGLEKAVTYFMPIMLVLLLIIAIYAMSQGDVAQTVRFMFYPDFSKLSFSSVLVALGHAFFTLSLASGAIMVYGAYLPEGASIAKSAVAIAIADTLVALIAGLAIYPIVFGNGLEASQGPGLVFVSLPIAFGQMTGGTILGTLFFIMLSFAALTSAISMIESAAAWFVEKHKYSRVKAATVISVLLWLMSLLTVFSFTGASWTKLGFNFLGKEVGNFFELLDHLTSDILLPLGGMFIAIFVTWVMKPAAVIDEIKLPTVIFTLWYNVLKWFTPFAVLFVFLNLVGVLNL